jgi:hypothetical protein
MESISTSNNVEVLTNGCIEFGVRGKVLYGTSLTIVVKYGKVKKNHKFILIGKEKE